MTFMNMRTLRKLVVASALFASAATTFALSTSPVGTWKTLDENTGQPKALIQISENADGTLSGVLVKGLEQGANPQPRCTKCTDERKDQRLWGMTIVRSMKHDGDVWDGGNILDPESGKVYRCRMSLADDGQQLVVRGYIGVSLLGRSQTWMRQ
jgi:uncharacterized protein (DUF2147 family)